MITIKSEAEINIMRQSGKILAKTLTELQNLAKPGVSTKFLDDYAKKRIAEFNAIPSFIGVPGEKYPFPSAICTTIDYQAVHGVPNTQTVLKKGQILTIDIGVYYKGFHTDSATTFYIEEADPMTIDFIETTRQTLYKAIKLIKPQIRFGDISAFIGNETKKNGHHVIKELIGHGIGRTLHEAPQIPNYGRSNTKETLQSGMTFCIEPIVGLKTGKIFTEEDGWTISSIDYNLTCQQEHTILVTDNGFEILTLRENENFA